MWKGDLSPNIYFKECSARTLAEPSKVAIPDPEITKAVTQAGTEMETTRPL